MNTTEDLLLCHAIESTRNQATQHALAALLKQANRDTVPSGVLLTSTTHATRLDSLTGGPDSPALTQLEFEALYESLCESTLGGTDPIGGRLGVPGRLPSADENHAVSTDADNRAVVPIILVDVAYERLRKRWFATLTRSANLSDDSSAAATMPLADAVTSKQAFFAGLLLPADYALFARVNGKHYGRSIRFSLPQDGYRGNRGRTLVRVELGLPDGQTVSLVPGATQDYGFSETGEQQIVVTAFFDDGAVQHARLAFEVAESAPVTDEVWTFADSSSPTAATAYVYYARVNGPRRTKIEKPVLIAEGFPGGRTLNQLWPLVNQATFARELIARGRDVIILGFRDGTRSIQDSAALYQSCVATIIQKKNNAEKIAAGGGSMGGLVARYALCKMEKAGIDHHTNCYFSIDTPHEGANIPVSAQAFVQLYAAKPCGERAADSARLMSSPAAQQMLLQWVPPYAQWENGRRYPLASPLRGAFVRDLLDQGWMPQKVRRVGVADGVGTGVGNGVPAGAHALNFSLSIFHWADMWASGEHVAKVVEMVNGVEFWRWEHGSQRIDGAPGGTSNTWEEAWRSLPRCTLYHGRHCFVPSVSACAIVSADLYLTDLPNRPSALHAFKCSSTGNLGHVVLTPELKTFLVDEIMKP